MPDREKTIKELEKALSNMDERITPEDVDKLICTAQDALSLLKAQEPLAVRITDDFGAIKFGNCPKCGSIINNQGYPKSCGCGQAVKWVEPQKEET